MKTKVNQLLPFYSRAKRLNIKPSPLGGNIDFAKEFFWGLLVLLIATSFVYAYLVNNTIFNIVERKNINKEMVLLNLKVSDLESEYFTLSNKIDLPYIYALGYKDSLNKTEYATRKALSTQLSLNNRL